MSLRVRIVQPLIPRYREPLFARLAQREGIDLEVWADLAPSQGSLEGLAGSERFRCVHAPYRERGPFIWQPGVWRAVDPGSVDAVILPWNTRYAHLLPGLLRGKHHGIRTVLWGHGVGKHEGAVRRTLRDATLRFANGCVLYGPSVAERLRRDGVPGDRIFVAPNSIDLAAVATARSNWSDASVDAFLAGRGLSRGRIVLYVGRLESWKRPRLLLEALEALRRRGSGVHAVFIGDGPERPMLEAFARERGIAEAAHFLGAIYDETRLAPYMLGAACVVIPAAIGLSLLHAFGYGLPVVTSDHLLPHGPEIDALLPGENGLLIRDGDPQAFADAIESMVDDPVRRDRMSRAARATVERSGGWNLDTMVDAFVAAVTPPVFGQG